VVLGSGGETYGLALYADRGALAEVAALVEADRVREAARIESLSVTLDDKPAYVIRSLEAAFGVAAVPTPMRTGRGELELPSEQDVVALAAAMDAVAQLTPASLMATAHLEVGAHQLQAEAHLPTSVVRGQEEATDQALHASATIGRNDPCPCGSGRKYKRCHLPLDKAASSRGPAPVHSQDERLVGELVNYASRALGERWHEAVGTSYPLKAEAAPPELQLLVPWSVYECKVDGQAVVDRYLEERGRRLAPADRAWLEAQQRAWLSIWEVRDVEAGERIAVRDLLTGEAATVTEVAASRSLARRDVILARVVVHEGTAVFCGIHPRVLGPIDADAVVASIRRKLRVRSAPVAIHRLKEQGTNEAVLAAWRKNVAARDRMPPPQLTNTDGDPILLTVDHFAFAPDSRPEIERRIAAIEHVGEPERDGDRALFSLLRPGNRMHRSWENTVLGTVVVSEGGLRLEANSVRRADELRRALEATCSPLLTHRIREHADPTAQLGRSKGRTAPQPKTLDDEAGAVLRAFKAKMYEDWIDEPIPMLGGLTPRQASARPPQRRKLILLLRDIENKESRLPETERFDVGALRARLGIPAD
jgi:hypothetical protein